MAQEPPQEANIPQEEAVIGLKKNGEKYDYRRHEFDQTENVQLHSNAKPAGFFRDLISVWDYNGKKVPVPARWHPNSVVKRIVQHNKLGQYTGIVMIGQSGSGKTTLTRKLVHQIHMMGEEYVVKWFNGHEMLHMDEHIKNMQVGTPHIMIFDDASYTLEDAKKSEVAKLANALTTIRHTLKSRIIMVMNIHYSKATMKFFRNQHFTFLTSVSVEEMGNYQDLFKDKMHVIRAFGKTYNKMMLRGYFEAPVSSFESTVIKYKTNEPFRVCLVAEVADLHFMLYDRAECAKCKPISGKEKKQPKSIQEIIEKFGGMYHGKNGKLPNEFAVGLRYFAKIQTGTNTLSNMERSVWNSLTSIQKAGFNDWEGLCDEVSKMRRKKNKLKHGIKAAANATVFQLARAIKKEQAEEESKSEPKMVTPDYDSTYMPE